MFGKLSALNLLRIIVVSAVAILVIILDIVFFVVVSLVVVITVITSRFLVADTQLYKRLCPSVGRSVGRSVRW